MKITKEYLKRVINEELARVVKENEELSMQEAVFGGDVNATADQFANEVKIQMSNLLKQVEIPTVNPKNKYAIVIDPKIKSFVDSVAGGQRSKIQNDLVATGDQKNKEKARMVSELTGLVGGLSGDINVLISGTSDGQQVPVEQKLEIQNHLKKFASAAMQTADQILQASKATTVTTESLRRIIKKEISRLK
jgi:hypothetical protein